MPKLKNYEPGKRVNVWIPSKHLKIANQIHNLSAFLQTALELAPDIMTYAILKEAEPTKYETGNVLEDVIDQFNEQNPQNQLTQKRQGKWPKSSPNQPEAW